MRATCTVAPTAAASCRSMLRRPAASAPSPATDGAPEVPNNSSAMRWDIQKRRDGHGQTRPRNAAHAAHTTDRAGAAAAQDWTHQRYSCRPFVLPHASRKAPRSPPRALRPPRGRGRPTNGAAGARPPRRASRPARPSARVERGRRAAWQRHEGGGRQPDGRDLESTTELRDLACWLGGGHDGVSGAWLALGCAKGCAKGFLKPPARCEVAHVAKSVSESRVCGAW